MIDQAGPVPIATLEEAKIQFHVWSSNPHRNRRIPDALWDTAVRLCTEHWVCKVSRALGLDYKALRLRCHGSDSPRAFVELTPVWSQGEVRVECDDGHRRQLGIHCKGTLDPRLVGLLRTFLEGAP